MNPSEYVGSLLLGLCIAALALLLATVFAASKRGLRYGLAASLLVGCLSGGLLLAGAFPINLPALFALSCWAALAAAPLAIVQYWLRLDTLLLTALLGSLVSLASLGLILRATGLSMSSHFAPLAFGVCVLAGCSAGGFAELVLQFLIRALASIARRTQSSA